MNYGLIIYTGETRIIIIDGSLYQQFITAVCDCSALYICMYICWMQIAVMTASATSSVLVSVLKPVYVECSLSLVHVNQVSKLI